MSRYRPKVRAATAQVRPAVIGTWAASRQWFVGLGLWLMLCVEVLLLAGSLTYIVVTLAPYLWP